MAKVDAARNEWIGKLVDLSRRNNLLYFRDLKVGTLDLSGASSDRLQALLQSGRTTDDGVSLTDLFGESDLFSGADASRAAASLREIAARAVSNFEEKGLATLFLAVGLASWTTSDEGRDTAAPVLLVPIEAISHGGHSGRWVLRRGGEVQVNDVLTHALQAEHGVSVVPHDVLGDDERETLDLAPAFARLKEAARAVPGFDIKQRWVVGNFAFQKLAIVKDLRDLAEALARNNIIAGIAGDDDARAGARGERAGVDPIDIDRTHPDNEFLILDADSSQQHAIGASLQGQNGVISGPPGTGKSQTIANLIAEFVSRGKTVLFVAEKRAALDVVKNRLLDVDLAHLCLDCHGAETSRRMIAAQLQESLNLIRDATVPDASQLHAKFVEKRQRLNLHVASMHSLRLAAGLSLYQMYGQLLNLPKDAESGVRLARPVIQAIKRADVDASCELLREAASHADLVTGTSTSPWVGAVFVGEEGARQAIEDARSLAGTRWAACQTEIGVVVSEAGIKPPRTVGDLRRVVDLLAEIRKLLSLCREDIFARPLDQLVTTLRPARGVVSRWWAVMSSSDFRRAVRDVGGLCHAGRIPSAGALALAESAKTQLGDWWAVTSAEVLPKWSPDCEALISAWSDVAEDLKGLVDAFPLRRFEDLQVGTLGKWLQDLAADGVTPAQLLRLQEIERSLAERGLAPVLADIRLRKPAAESWTDLLRYAWLASSIEEVQLSDTAVPAFRGRYHDEIASEFRSLDAERLDVAVQRVRRAHAQAAIDALNRFPSQSTVISREAQKKSRHLPLRRLFSEAPNVLLALRPCWMASPLSVSQLIPGDRPYFDVVVFDEASQVLPEDAVTSLLRGRQAVIAGDRRQLPPTTFFAAGDDDAESAEAGATGGFESILDVMSAFLDPPWSLDWHYRSRDEALIAYSNHRIYGGRLITFPGPGLRKAVSHELVPYVAGQAGQEQSASLEVRRVVDLILEHARTRPTESLGVIAMGITHAKRIEMEFDRARQGRPDLEQFFATNRSERFFIKNLERVQGDERDAIILSVGYGKNEAGRLVYRFGPLLQQGGERRLNVAITRARKRMTLVSSFSHLDVDPNYANEGVRHLRNYLEYAASGGRSLGLGAATDVPLNDFEQAVFDALTRRGLKLVGQLGSSNYRIDMVAMHPEKAGRFVLAIECDGASYHSTPTARDRDRLRQQQLEALGWRFCRIWSTDWFLRRDEEIQRVLKAFDTALRLADAEDDRGDAGGVQTAPPPNAPMPSTQSASAPTVRNARPLVAPGLTIADYRPSELQIMVRWIKSDGKLRTDEEILSEVVRELGFLRRGTRIVEAVNDAIRSVRGDAGTR